MKLYEISPEGGVNGDIPMCLYSGRHVTGRTATRCVSDRRHVSYRFSNVVSSHGFTCRQQPQDLFV